LTVGLSGQGPIRGLGPAPFPQAPQPPPTAQFRSGIDLVEVNVSVTDRDGRPVRDLTRKDFEVRESGTPQTVAIFDRVEIPIPPPVPPGPRTPAIAADVAANDFQNTGRAFAVVLDDLTQYPVYTQRTRNIARQFIERHVGPEDLVLVMATSGRAELTQEFTTDKGRALQAVERFIGLLPLCPPDTRCPDLPDRIDPDAELNSYRSQTLETIGNLATHLAGLQGRRASVLFIGDGFKIPMAASTGGGDLFASQGMFSLSQTALLTGTERTAEALQGANATFFAVRTDPDGGMGSVAKANALDALADATGGVVGVNNSSFVGRDFDRVIAETSHYYLLGYYPTARRTDGQYRSIDVRVRRPDVRVSHRPGYRYRAPAPAARTPAPTLATRRAAPPPLATLLDHPMPTAGLPLRVQAIPLRHSDTEARVQLIVEVAGQDLAFEERDGRLHEVIQFATVAYSDKGRRGPERTTEMRLRLTPAERDRLTTTGVRWVSVLDLPRGRHDLRVAARATRTDRQGSVYVDVDVPRFDTEMTTSGLAVTSRTAAATFMTGGPILLPPLPAPPTVQRRFVTGDVLAVSAEVYQPTDGRGLLRRRVTEPVPTELRIRITEATSLQRVVVDQPLPVMAQGHRTPYVSFAINTANIGAGRFVMRLVRVGKDPPGDLAPGAVPFEVVAK
jgi:VWFA-related protein